MPELGATGEENDLAIAVYGCDWRDAEGKRFFTGIMRDISARKAGEARRALLMREVDHRAKNALAAGEIEQVLDKLLAR